MGRAPWKSLASTDGGTRLHLVAAGLLPWASLGTKPILGRDWAGSSLAGVRAEWGWGSAGWQVLVTRALVGFGPKRGAPAGSREHGLGRSWGIHRKALPGMWEGRAWEGVAGWVGAGLGLVASGQWGGKSGDPKVT